MAALAGETRAGETTFAQGCAGTTASPRSVSRSVDGDAELFAAAWAEASVDLRSVVDGRSVDKGGKLSTPLEN
jgi:hypothetical protein